METMQPYGNVKGDSGVESYACGDDYIKVRFLRGPVYVYDYTKPGAIHVERMKELARSGRGLATYISQHVQKDYARTEP